MSDREDYLRIRAENVLKELAEYNDGISVLLGIAIDFLFDNTNSLSVINSLDSIEENIVEVENLVIEYISNVIESTEGKLYE